MARYTIDAPTLLRLVESGPATVHPAHQLVAPVAIRSQALAILLSRVSGGELTEADALAVHERLTETRIRALNDRVSRRKAWQVARMHGWTELTAAEYLAVTLLQADALVTVDERLATLAQGVVPLAPFEALGQP